MPSGGTCYCASHAGVGAIAFCYQTFDSSDPTHLLLTPVATIKVSNFTLCSPLSVNGSEVIFSWHASCCVTAQYTWRGDKASASRIIRSHTLRFLPARASRMLRCADLQHSWLHLPVGDRRKQVQWRHKPCPMYTASHSSQCFDAKVCSERS